MATAQPGVTVQNRNDVEIQQLEPQPVLSIRATVRVDQLGEAMGDRIPALLSYLQQHGVQPAGPLFVRYHTFGEIETDVETGIPLVAPATGADRIAGSALPGGPAITTWHMGPHHTLGEAYARIAAWQKEHGRAPASPSWEVYHWINLSQHDDGSTWGDPTTWRTQLIQPIK